MDVQLQELIDKIKKDGVASAENSAGKIIAEAEKKAQAIIKEAESKADSIIKTAKAETSRMEKASEDAITQAGRNLIISFRDGINKELSALVLAETEKAYDKDLLKKLIPETVKSWAASPSSDDLTVLLPAKDLKALEGSLKSALKAKISKGLEIKGDASLASGFRVGSKDGSAFYDFSADEVAALFSAYLNPKTTELMKNAAASISGTKVSVAPEKIEVAKAEKAPAKKASAKKAPAKNAKAAPKAKASAAKDTKKKPASKKASSKKESK